MKTFKLIYFIAVVAFFACLGILYAVLPVKSFSEMENRVLTGWPGITADGVFSGDVQKDIETATSDQFIFRDECVRAEVAVLRLLGKKDINGVYFGRDHVYIEKVTESDVPVSKFTKLLGVCDMIAGNTDATISVMLAPSPGNIYPEKLPENAQMYDGDKYESLAEAALKKASFISVKEEMKAAKDDAKLYFDTDHHWTDSGAYIAAGKYLEGKGIMIAPASDYDVKQVSDEFYGTLFSKAPASDAVPDELCIPEGKGSISVEIKGKEQNTIYDMAKLDTKDKYAVYFGGNFDRVTITNNEAKYDMGHLCLIKDSYANSLVPYLIPYYSRIDMIDARYFSGSFKTYLSEEAPEEILVCYEMSNFIKDGNIIKLIK